VARHVNNVPRDFMTVTGMTGSFATKISLSTNRGSANAERINGSGRILGPDSPKRKRTMVPIRRNAPE